MEVCKLLWGGEKALARIVNGIWLIRSMMRVEGMMLRSVRSSKRLRKEHGVWVFRTGKKLSASITNRVVRSVREQRDRHNVGTP